jgi:hypothetical protein
MAYLFIEYDFYKEIEGTDYFLRLLEDNDFDTDWEVEYLIVPGYGAIFEQLHFVMN